MTETLVDRAARVAVVMDCTGREHAATAAQREISPTLRELAAAHEAMATERNEALAAVTTAEQRAVNADAERDALAAEVAALREALNLIMERDRVKHRTGDPELGAIYTLGPCGRISSAALAAAGLAPDTKKDKP